MEAEVGLLEDVKTRRNEDFIMVGGPGLPLADPQYFNESHESCELREMVSVDPWDMLNNFCFHHYAQKSVFMSENCNGLFYISFHLCFFLDHSTTQSTDIELVIS